MRAAKEFNLTLSRFDSEADNELGIWDGSRFVIMVRVILNSAHTYTADNNQCVLDAAALRTSHVQD